MLFATRPRLFHSRLLALLVVAGGLASGCQSSRPSFSFQPAPGRARAVDLEQPAATETKVIAAREPISAVVASRPAVVQRVRQQPQTEIQQAPKQAVVTPENLTVARASVVPHRRPLLGRAHATAEAGLGTTVLGVLGLVVLPIALIGLAISGGGLVWGIVAGAAALAVLVAYIDPFGRR
ncbi:hypothetical protein ACFP2F_19985 [Hymenobacter artigasi]|uniref:Uncharacterized protein n=1 Tax=Hymenobacter artigasi TaxID=2719616 RepID=A0ABX1HQN6_9BACT|nr:hypothetical protein [Hymenobacter artigasi]NKI91416.1 hypothetical protein [Hymenobacter artigasi]